MKTRTLTLSLFIVVMTSIAAFAQVEPVGKDKVAIGGYDLVAYFKQNKAVKGTPANKTTYDNVIYYFANAEDKDTFSKNPEAYLPQYDGYCALAIGTKKKKVSINPETFKVTDGKLYLFYNATLPLGHEKFNSLEPWNEDEPNLIKKADSNWPTLKDTKRHVK